METAWLAENPTETVTYYAMLAGRSWSRTTDPNKAFRLARREDALQLSKYMAGLTKKDWFPTEHAWPE